MGCIFHARVNQLWSLWYTVAVLILQVYLVYLGLERYRLYSDMKWPHGAYPTIWLNVYVVLYAVCIPTLLLFAAFGIFKSGNIAGDNDRLGARVDRVIELTNTNSIHTGCSLFGGIKSLWQHAPPLPQLLHVLMALMQLFAQQVMLAQLYRYGFINSGDFLNTELDFVYQRARQLATNLPMLDNRLQGFRISAHDLSGTPIGPNLLPILMHARLFGIPLEFVNVVLALFVYACSYASVFWRVSKPFSCLFSLHLLVHMATVIFSYLGFSVLYRIQETNYASVRPVGLGQYLSSSKPLHIYHPLAIIATYITTVVLLHLAPIAVYTYGYTKYFMDLMAAQHKNSRVQGTSLNGAVSEYSRTYHKTSTANQLCCDGYAPHICAIVLLVLVVVVKAPTIYALMVLYQHEEKPLLLSCIIIDISYLFTWIVFWLLLTLKRDWHFVVLHGTHELIALQSAHRIMSSNAQVCNRTLADLKNALIMVHADQMYITDEPMAKQSLLRHAHKHGLGTADEVYWLKSNGAQSPTMRKIPLNDNSTNAPEMNRLLTSGTARRDSADEHTVASDVYHSICRRAPVPQVGMVQVVSASPPNATNTFGTLQRNQRSEYASTLSRPSTSPAQRVLTVSNALPVDRRQQLEAYASIHKAARGPIETRRDSMPRDENESYSVYGGSYAYGRIAPSLTSEAALQTRAMHNQMTEQALSSANHIQQVSVSQRLPPSSDTAGNRATPVIEERIAAQRSVRETSPYQRSTNLKLSSFSTLNDTNKPTPSWSQPRVIPSVQWANNPAYNKVQRGLEACSLSTSSSQQEQCFTPTSTLTSQGSVSNYTPTPGSPVLRHTADTYDKQPGSSGTMTAKRNANPPPVAAKPTRSATGSTSVRHHMKVIPSRQDDSANYSLTSSNESNEQRRLPSNDYATSIV